MVRVGVVVVVLDCLVWGIVQLLMLLLCWFGLFCAQDHVELTTRIGCTCCCQFRVLVFSRDLLLFGQRY
jgi:hypothetical protein